MFKLFLRRPKNHSDEKQLPTPKLIVGLGNPGEQYAFTYHNVGQLYIDHLSSETMKKYRHFAFTKKEDYILVKPLTFMNQSGVAVKEALKYFDLDPNSLVVVHDDSDLAIGDYKTTFDQSSAGHKGVQSIIDHLKTQRFSRVKIGVREYSNTKAGDFVLKPISKQGLSTLRDVFARISLP